MSDNFIDGLRALAEKHPRTVRSAARMRQPLDGADAQALEGALTLAERDRDEARAEVERLRADHDALRGAAREYLETLGGAMKSGKFEMAGTFEMAHFVRQAMQKLDSLVFDRDEPRAVGLEKLHEPHGRAS